MEVKELAPQNLKRGPGRITGSLSTKYFYKVYKGECAKKEITPIKYTIYYKLIRECNKKILNSIVEGSETVVLPQRLGTLRISKREQDLTKVPINKWPVDFKKSKELGFRVYHDQNYKCNWKWNKSKAVVKWKNVYYFAACRNARRLVPEAIKFRKRDYFL